MEWLYCTCIVTVSTSEWPACIQYVRLYQELRESVETQLIKEGKKDVEETEGTRKSSALGALQNQLAAISKVVHSQ